MHCHNALATVALVLLLAAPVSWSADIYRWVDDEGVVHYTQAPPGDRDAQRVESARPPADDPEQRRKETEDLIESNKVRRYEKQLERETAAQDERHREDVREFCTRLRAKRDKLANSPKVREKTADGYRVMSYEERQEKLEEFDARLDERCRDQ